MTLKEYLLAYRITVLEFALICKVTPTTIYNILKGNRVRKKLAARVLKKTSGLVDLFEIPINIEAI